MGGTHGVLDMDLCAKWCLAASTPMTALIRHAVQRVLLSITWLAWVGLIAGCGSGGPGGSPPASSNNATPAVTQVTVVLSSDANDQFTDFDAVLQGITLTNSSGKSVTLLSQSLGTEFVHLNGLVEPIITGTLPQDTYTAATVSVGGAQFACMAVGANGGLQDSVFAYGYVPAPDASVNLPAPISVTGNSMGLTLRMLVQQSAILSSCSGGASYAIRPTFTLTSFDIANAAPGSASTTALSLEGAVTAVSGTSGSFEVQRPAYLYQSATSLKVSIDDGTALQGVDGLASLTVGMFVDFDGAIQADGSVHATRVAVADPAAVDVRRGPVISVFRQDIPIFVIQPIEGQGKDGLVTTETYDFSGATFHISGQLSNVQQLPFAATFDAANMVPGQNVYLSSPAFVTCCGQDYYAPATTMTLMPQTIDATVVGSSVNGNFTIYTVQLPDYDLFVTLAAQPAQASLLTQPDQVQVYVDSGTRMFNSDPVAPGSTLRFYGLVFNDQGVLRMDCAAINDGVALSN
jgi:predicted small lipoprotein YifL